MPLLDRWEWLFQDFCLSYLSGKNKHPTDFRKRIHFRASDGLGKSQSSNIVVSSCLWSLIIQHKKLVQYCNLLEARSCKCVFVESYILYCKYMHHWCTTPMQKQGVLANGGLWVSSCVLLMSIWDRSLFSPCKRYSRWTCYAGFDKPQKLKLLLLVKVVAESQSADSCRMASCLWVSAHY